MPSTVVINSSNLVSGTTNQFQYNFPSSWKSSVGDSVGVQSVSIYNSTFNITSARGNNVLVITWNANTSVNYTLTFADGYYSISDINSAIQYFCLTNLLYLSTPSGNVFYVELQTNSVQYSAQLNLFPLPIALPSGYTIPSGATWSLPASAKTPQVQFSSVALCTLLGLPNFIAQLPVAPSASILNYLSTATPILSPVNGYIFTCSLLNSRFSIPNNVMFSLPISVGIGSLIIQNSQEVVYNSVAPNIYSGILITIFDNNMNSLNGLIKDTELTLTLSIKYGSEK